MLKHQEIRKIVSDDTTTQKMSKICFQSKTKLEKCDRAADIINLDLKDIKKVVNKIYETSY